MAPTHRMLGSALFASTVAAASLRYSASSHSPKSPQIADLPNIPELARIFDLPDTSKVHSLPEALSSGSSNSASESQTGQGVYIEPKDLSTHPYSLTSSTQYVEQKRNQATDATLKSIPRDSHPFVPPLPPFLTTAPSPESVVGGDSGTTTDADPSDGTDNNAPWGNATTSDTNPYTEVPNTGVVRSYDFTLTRSVLNLDANWGDTFEITAHNQITDPVEGTAIHWHGMLQKGTPWMDGTPSVGSSPLAPGQSFTYRFLADLYGTSWWHAHYSGQYVAGILGPMIVYGPIEEPYDVDLGPIMMQDYYHDDYFSLVSKLLSPSRQPVEPPSENTGINGRFDCLLGSDGTCSFNPDLANFEFTPGQVHRLRLINVGAENLLRFSIDEHDLTVIANDLVPLQPYITDHVNLAIGQRTDVLVTANGTANSYWMRVSARCGISNQPEGRAIVYYNRTNTNPDVSADPESPVPSATAIAGRNLQPNFSTVPTSTIVQSATTSYWSTVVQTAVTSSWTTTTIASSFSAATTIRGSSTTIVDSYPPAPADSPSSTPAGGTLSSSTLSTYPPTISSGSSTFSTSPSSSPSSSSSSYIPIPISPTDIPLPTTSNNPILPRSCINDPLSLTIPRYPIPLPSPTTTYPQTITITQNATQQWNWEFNGITFHGNYNSPVLFLAQQGNTTYPFDPQWNVVNLGQNTASYRFVTYNRSPRPHPMHLHGHNVYVLAEGTGEWDGSITRPENPLRRDVALLQPGGFLVTQADADNAGVWPYHCHLAWHLTGGLSINYIEREEEIQDLQIPEEVTQMAQGWEEYSSQNVVQQIDSGFWRMGAELEGAEKEERGEERGD
ncbi:MAG: hypothetical protein Q9160_002865 [Pyrenula sp. 1 TL-2023]